MAEEPVGNTGVPPMHRLPQGLDPLLADGLLEAIKAYGPEYDVHQLLVHSWLNSSQGLKSMEAERLVRSTARP